MASDFWQSCLNLSHAGITGLCHHAEALRVWPHLSDPPLPSTPRDTHKGSLAALSLLGNPAPRSGTVFLEQAGRLHWEAAWLPLPRQPGPHPTPEFALTSWIYVLAWPQAAPCLSRQLLSQLQPASLCPIHVSLLGGGGSTATEVANSSKPNSLTAMKGCGPGKPDQKISSSLPTTQPENPAVTSLQTHHLL